MKIIFCVLLLQICSVFVISQEWIVPVDKSGRLSPYFFNDSLRKAGMQLYTINCISCHGAPGKGNFQRLVPPPGDPATEKIQRNSDGEIYYKITEGRGQMPSFKNVLSANDVWNIISYFRSFNPSYAQSVMPVITSGAYPGAIIGISLMLSPGKESIQMKVSATKDNSVVPVRNAGVKLFVKRTFGMLELDEEKTTDAEGFASFSLPVGIPGDTAGNLQVSARFTDEDLFGSISKDTVLQAGIKVIPVSLVKERAMWNTVRKAPLWILLTYSLGVLLVWGLIFVVLFKLRDIFIIGEHIGREKTREE